MRKISVLSILLSVCLMSFATDWSSIAYLGDGAGGGSYSNKYKVDPAFGQTVVNIQLDGDKPAIYTNFPAAVTSCSLSAGQYREQGAGIYLYLTAFTAKVTAVTVEAGGVSYDFQVYFEDGTGEIPDYPQPGGDPQPGELTPATYHGSEVIAVSGTDVTFTWSITRNADATLTFEISWSSDISGVVPQVNIDDVYTTMPFQGRTARFTTKATYVDGTNLAIFFLVAYTGNAARIDVAYTVGASNDGPQPSAIENILNNESRTHKVIENGMLYIIKDGVRYNALGVK